MPMSDQNLEKICDSCRQVSRILGSNISGAIDVPHHKSYPAFLQSAEGCLLCSLIVQSIQKYRDRIVEILCSCSRELKIHVKYFQGWQSNSFAAPLEDNFYFELFRDRDQLVDTEHVVFGRSILEDPAEAVVNVAKPWISECQKDHARCRQVEQGHLPSRVLDVSKDGDKVFLVNSKPLSGSYTVLSHCWGTVLTLTTTTANIAQHMESIPCTELPATFRDAVRITRLLGISYLWIDSLCIIQDQLSDWEHESAKMHEYYKNSFVTIAALESKNSFAGMLHPREILSVQLPDFENLFLRPRIPAARLIYEYSILESRAWCLQERLLSTRVIHVAKSELLWECRTNHRRESSVQIGDSVAIEGFYRFGPDRLKRTLDDLEIDPRCAEKAPEFWYNLVQQYSRRNLTNPKDMLPAILGVAKQIEKFTGLTYTWGLWREDFLRGLLWTNDSGKASIEQVGRAAGAPSWSWAVTTGKKYWPKVQTKSQQNLQSGTVLISVLDRELVLRCRYIGVSFKRSRAPPRIAKDIPGQNNGHILEYGCDLNRTREVYLTLENDGYANGSRVRAKDIRVGWMMVDDTIIDPDSYVSCRALEILYSDEEHPSRAETGSGKDTQSVYPKVWFLLVVPHPDHRGSWKRIGVGVSANPDKGQNAIEAQTIFEGAENECISLL